MSMDFFSHKNLYVKVFTFNEFQENTYIVFDETEEAVIIDPGCSTNYEFEELFNFINKHRLNPVRLLNTHCHIDHIIGNWKINEVFGLSPEIHKNEEEILKMGKSSALIWGIYHFKESPLPSHYLEDEEEIGFGNSYLKVVYAPGHSPGHVFFYSPENNFIISGDIIFHMSIGRTDLPGGNYRTLLKSIKEKIMTLPPDVVIYPGHGEITTVGQEALNNPFVLEWKTIS